jgi:hypothetical protein
MEHKLTFAEKKHSDHLSNNLSNFSPGASTISNQARKKKSKKAFNIFSALQAYGQDNK